MPNSVKILKNENDALDFYKKVGMVKIEIFHMMLSQISTRLSYDMPVQVWYPATISNNSYFFIPCDLERWSMSSLHSAANFGLEGETIGICTSLIAFRLLLDCFPNDVALTDSFNGLRAFASTHKDAYVINRICFEG